MRTPRLRLLSALLSVAMLFTFLPTAAFAASTTFTVDKIQYTVTDEGAKTVSVTKYTGTDPNVVIPKTVDYNSTTYTVTAIGENAFKSSSLTNIAIPNGVTSIGNYAFHSSSLKSIDISESVTSIGDYAFAYCRSLTNITIPSSIVSLGNSIFEESSLQSVTFGDSIQLASIPDHAFASCKSLTQIVLPDSVKAIENQAFDTCSHLTSITLPEGLERIGKWAFADSALRELTIPKTVTAIDPNAFQYSKFAGSNDSIIRYDGTFEQWRKKFGLSGILSEMRYSHTVIFHTNTTTTTIPDQTVYDSEYVTEPTKALTKDGYLFDGWYTDEACTNKFEFENGKSTTAVSGNLDLYAKWISNKRTVAFNTNGHGDAISPASVAHGTKVSAPASPSEYGYNFEGWYTDAKCTAGNKFNFDADGRSTETITKDITLFAKWTPKSYKVTFKTDKATPYHEQNVAYKNFATKPSAPGKTGYIFDGWYEDEDCHDDKFNFGTAITRDITLYAKWTVNTYTVTVNNDNGTSPTKTSPAYNTKVEVDVPEKAGYAFIGWIADPSSVIPVLNTDGKYEFTMPAHDVTLTANWSTNAYTVTFDGNGHDLDVVKVSVAYNTPVEKPATPTTLGYTFGGWYTDKDCTTAFDFNTPITADTTLYAKWTKNAEPVKPSDPDKPSEPGKPSKPDTPNTPDTPSNPDKPSKPETKTYSVFVFDGEAELDGETVTTAEAGKTITVRLMADIVPAGQTFDHWEVLPETLELKDAQSTETTFVMPEEAVTLRAVYRDIPSAPQSVDPASAALGAAVIGTGVVIAGWTAYNIGLELYAKWVLPAGAEMPNTRGELAVLLWQAAGSPEPATLTEGMSELEKAERWVVDNGLMAESKNSSFAPEEKVSKLEVFLTLKKAKALTQ